MSDVRRKPAGEPQIGERLDAGLLLHGELYWPGTPRLRTERATVMPGRGSLCSTHKAARGQRSFGLPGCMAACRRDASANRAPPTAAH